MNLKAKKHIFQASGHSQKLILCNIQEAVRSDTKYLTPFDPTEVWFLLKRVPSLRVTGSSRRSRQIPRVWAAEILGLAGTLQSLPLRSQTGRLRPGKQEFFALGPPPATQSASHHESSGGCWHTQSSPRHAVLPTEHEAVSMGTGSPGLPWSRSLAPKSGGLCR